jgi:short chain dehydrogenase
MKTFQAVFVVLQLLSIVLTEASSNTPRQQGYRIGPLRTRGIAAVASLRRDTSSPRDRWSQRITDGIIRGACGRIDSLWAGGLALGRRSDGLVSGVGERENNEFDDEYHCTNEYQPREPSLTSPSGRRRFQGFDHSTWNRHGRAADASAMKLIAASSSSASFQDAAVNRPQRSRMWPPWPFNLLQSQGSASGKDGATSTSGVAEAGRQGQGMGPAASLLLTFLQKSAHAGLLNLQYMTSQLLFHLPPASPPLLLLACIPQHRTVQQLSDTNLKAWTVPLTSDPFVRTIALSCLGLAVLSWAHSQVHRLNAMTPLPIAPEFQDVHRAVLPPFLPDEEHTAQQRLLDAALLGDDEGMLEDALDNGNLNEATFPPYLQSLLQWNPFGDGSNGTRPPRGVGGGRLRGALRAWRQEREARRMDRHNAHRIAVMEQLLALQGLKQKSAERKKGKTNRSRGGGVNGIKSSSTKSERQTIGYGLVTGASRGIGRAIAVELARFGIPLVLVARDLDRLTSLAYDLQACYGIDCCVLQADLTQPHAAAAVYRSVQDAGLTVDVLVKYVSGLLVTCNPTLSYLAFRNVPLQQCRVVVAWALRGLSHQSGG